MKNIKFLMGGIILHRGLHKDVPENSMEAFKRGINSGFPIELDVHLTKDGKVIVFHDDYLYRMCGKRKYLKDCNYEDICELRLSHSKYRIPTLEEVLKLVDGAVPLIIELKYDSKVWMLEKEVARILDGYTGEFCVKSFSPLSVLWFRIYRPGYIRGLLISDKRRNFKEWFISSNFMIWLCRPDFISCNYKLYNDKRIKRFKGVVLAWTIRSKANFKKYKDKFDCLIVEGFDF